MTENSETEDVAIITKIAQNLLIGFICAGLAIIWEQMKQPSAKKEKFDFDHNAATDGYNIAITAPELSVDDTKSQINPNFMIPSDCESW